MTRFREGVVALAVLLGLWSAVFVPTGLDAGQAAIFGLVLVTLSLWATGVVPGYVGSTFFLTALLLAGLGTPEVVFSGFTSTAMWLVVAGFVIGAAITQTGLGRRIGQLAERHLSHSYPVLIGGLMLVSMALGFVMPASTGRAAVMLPIGMALADAVGLKPGSTGRRGVAVVLAFGTNMPSMAILPSNIPNVLMSGLGEQLFGVHLSYASYLLVHYPVLGIVKSAVIVGLVLVFFPARLAPKQGQAPGRQEGTKAAPGGRQGLLLAILLVTLVLWSTDRFHGLNPAWVGLATAFVLMVPQLGLVPPPAFKASIDFGTLLFIAGALSLGVVVTQSGLGAIIAHRALEWLPIEQGRDFRNFMSLSLLGAGTSVFTTMPGVPAVLTPLTAELAESTGFSLEAVLMAQVIGFSTALFPYQVTPMIVAMGLAGEPVRALLRVTLALFAVTVLVLIPLDYLWWKLLGVI